MVSGAVQAALDATFGKFVKSLRTVLEDLGKRVDAQGQSVTELQGALDGITQQLESQVHHDQALLPFLLVARSMSSLVRLHHHLAGAQLPLALHRAGRVHQGD